MWYKKKYINEMYYDCKYVFSQKPNILKTLSIYVIPA